MGVKNTTTYYGSISQLLHWIIFLLVAGMLILGFVMGDVSDKTLRGEMINIHKLTGVLILVLMLLRVLWALYNVKPVLPFQTPAWQRLAERSMHVLLYLGLIIMPLSGLVGSVAGGKPPVLDGISIRLPIGLNKPLAKMAFEYVHEPLAVVLIVLISIHIIAALYHHFIKRDDILRRMLPSRGRR
ncbi:hypothetical protein AQUSIP_21520 [Aquicella siphonis]|uniref:Cytochrome b561 bacterial/Ni-hydrogenase domain-containing protein n=1 Tax=Aquicella siphonis TaxID=254247 RepID=A0A5E4PJT4_9COXI|nr:cytochrome b [Aquicella siphonis]VVC76825.1 hypothetical protein AQUSIP_21520 [Aquicella siphonis]